MTTKEELIDEMEGIQRELQGYVDELMDEVEDAIEEAVENDNISLKRLQEIRDTLREVADFDILSLSFNHSSSLIRSRD